MASATKESRFSLLELDPEHYEPHFLHGPDRAYPETNCYTDILIEFLHAYGVEPLAMLGCTLGVDFEGDQWTFFKPRPDELEALYGLDVHEMQPYRPIQTQLVEQIEVGRTLIVEFDSFYLPDTAATSYRREHVKTSAVVEAIDPERESLRYFHNSGYHELSGEDYRGIFRLDHEYPGDVLPPYVELVRLDAGEPLRGDDLRRTARELLVANALRRPADNPFLRFGDQLAGELPNLLAGDSQRYHDYAFATVRMVGSAFDVAASYVEWALGAREGRETAGYMREIVSGCKTLSFKLARRRDFDPTEMIAALADAWEGSFASLEDALD